MIHSFKLDVFEYYEIQVITIFTFEIGKINSNYIKSLKLKSCWFLSNEYFLEQNTLYLDNEHLECCVVFEFLDFERCKMCMNKDIQVISRNIALLFIIYL